MLTNTIIELCVMLASFFIFLFFIILYFNKKHTKKQIKAVKEEQKPLSRREAIDYIKSLGNENITALEKHQNNPQFPVSIKWKTKTFAMLYAGDEGIVLVVRITSEYASEILNAGLKISRAEFPKGKDWYSILTDAETDKKLIFAILQDASTAIQQTKTSAAKKKSS